MLIRETNTTLCNQPSANANPVNGIHNAVHQPWNFLRNSGRPNSANTFIYPVYHTIQVGAGAALASASLAYEANQLLLTCIPQ